MKNILKAEIDPAFAKRAEFIFKEIEKERPQKVLDIGCGRGFYLKTLSFHSSIKEIHGIDINKEYLRTAKKLSNDKRIQIEKGSIYSLPYQDNHFDFIICSEVLEHLKDENKALSEIKRVLKKNGAVIFTVPNFYFPFLWDPLNWLLMKLFKTHISKNIWWLAGIWADHERLYKENELKQLIENSGFKIEKSKKFIRYCWPFSHFLLYGLGKNIVERLGIKEFNRFDFEPKTLSKVLAIVFKLPSKLDKRILKKTSVNIAIKAFKTS